MAKNARYRVQVRRRREGKTDFRARKALILSRLPRLVTRGSLRNITAQIIVAKPEGDEVLASAHSSELRKKYGWKAPTGNVPSAYLTGFICGLKAKREGITEAVLDIGLTAPTKGSRLFAVLNGALDAGMEIPYDEVKLVKERAKGEHIAKYGKIMGVGSEEFAAKFSKYLQQETSPEKMPELFSKIKADIISSFKSEVKEE
jgi:large subunit ribosomal protein L18